MERSELPLKPQWLKSLNGGASGNASSSHRGRNSWHSDEHGVGPSSRNKLSVVDQERSLSSSSRRDSSLNASRSRDKDRFGKSQAYSSFGRSSHDREREKDFGLHGGGSKFILPDNGFHDHVDPFTSRVERDISWRSHSPKRRGVPASNGVISRGTITGASFEKEFPSLGSEEKNGHPEPRRVASPGINTTIQSVPSTAAAIHGVGSWNSALAERPDIGTNGFCSVSLVQSSSFSLVSAAGSATGLNMAETVAQPPSRVDTPPESSIDAQKLEELTCRRFKQLRPVTPSVPKNTVSSSSEKMKNKGARESDSVIVPKAGQQFSPHSSVPALRSPVRSDITKPSQLGNFQVLSREKNGVSPTAKDAPNISKTTGSDDVAPSPSSVHPLKNPTNMSSSQGPFGKKRQHSQAKVRQEFFNSIRNKTSNFSSAVPETGVRVSTSSSMVDSVEQSVLGVHHENDNGIIGTGLDCLYKDNHTSEEAGARDEAERPRPSDEETDPCPEPVDPEEEALLQLLGWDKNSVEPSLTQEEIDSFYMELKERKQSSKCCGKPLVAV